MLILLFNLMDLFSERLFAGTDVAPVLCCLGGCMNSLRVGDRGGNWDEFFTRAFFMASHISVDVTVNTEMSSSVPFVYEI